MMVGAAPEPRTGMPPVRLDEAEGVQARRAGHLVSAGDGLEQPRQK